MTTPTPPPPAPPPTRTVRLTTSIAAATALVTAAATGVATTGGYVQSAVDWLKAGSQTASQVTALDERLKLVEGERKTLEADRAEAARMARVLDDAVRDVARSGADVDELQTLQRQLELRIERLDAQLGMLRERGGRR